MNRSVRDQRRSPLACQTVFRFREYPNYNMGYLGKGDLSNSPAQLPDVAKIVEYMIRELSKGTVHCRALTEFSAGRRSEVIKNTRDCKRTGSKKIADLYQQFAAETLHLDQAIAMGRHFGDATLLAERGRVGILESLSSQVRILKAEYGIL